ncbi:MAG: EAL domain-containing protein [Tenericutes bacterium]|nr:EAL domain-containing protein [Mycoplasmatota bacterium]
MNLIKLFAAANAAEAFELVTAAVLVIITIVALFFLYRNLSKEISEYRRNRDAMRKRDEDSENSDSEEDELDLDSKEFKDMHLFNQINASIERSPEGSLSALYSIDLDDFKNVCEDKSEKDIAKIKNELTKRLKKFGGKHSISGLLDDDSFLFYYFGQIDAESLSEMGEGLLKIIREPIKTGNVNLTASVGVCIFPYDGINAERLFKNAQIAVYVAKKTGKNQLHMYSEDLIDSEQYNTKYYQEIKKSISKDEFLLYYQTIVDVKTGKIIGLESLLRWNHPDKGILPPSKFINVMELTGDITWFGTWGFEKTVKQYKDWVTKTRIGDLFISTNLSPKQLEVENLAKQFFDITKKFGLSPEMFCLEINDYYAMESSKKAVQNLVNFRKYGFRISIDDLGPNFEIVADMGRIPAGIVKISRNNVLHIMDDGANTGFMKRVIKEAKDKSKIIVAEGLENEEMIKKIYDLGIRFMQGYYFNQPKSVIEIEKMIMKSPWNMSSFQNIIE